MAANVVQTFDSPIASLIDADTSFFFITEDEQLGVSDGTGAGTILLGAQGFGEDYEGSNGRVFFDGFSSASGEEPFVNNGTTEGSTLLLDINPIANETSDPLNFTSVGDVVYFTAFNEENGVALYSSDGTPEGTGLVADISEGTSNNNPFDEFVDINGTLYFVGENDANPIGIWKSDGTTEGTQVISSFQFSNSLNDLTVTEESLYFTRNVTGGEFWITDGTTDGTQLLLEANTDNLTGVGNNLFFTTSLDGFGDELWISNGTTEGTRLVEDILPSEIQNGTQVNDGSNPENLIDVNGTLFFTADDGVNGRALWTSDGTAEGTSLVADIDESTSSNLSVSNFTAVGDTLYFVQNAGFNNNLLWQSDGTTEGTFVVGPEEINLGGSTTPEFLNPSGLTEFENELYFTAESYDTNIGGYVPALLTLEDVDDSIVYRLFNPEVGVHFYTTDVAERDTFIDTGNYISEGASYRAADATDEGAEEVYRFFNETTGVHLYTTNEVERDSIQANLPEFEFEGAVFNAYETQVEGSIPVYRFFEPTIGVHLYTPSEVERNSVEANLPNYNFENIAYYALPLEADVSPEGEV